MLLAPGPSALRMLVITHYLSPCLDYKSFKGRYQALFTWYSLCRVQTLTHNMCFLNMKTNKPTSYLPHPHVPAPHPPLLPRNIYIKINISPQRSQRQKNTYVREEAKLICGDRSQTSGTSGRRSGGDVIDYVRPRVRELLDPGLVPACCG